MGVRILPCILVIEIEIEIDLAITEQTKLTDMTWIQRILEFVQIESKSSSLFELLE